MFFLHCIPCFSQEAGIYTEKAHITRNWWPPADNQPETEILILPTQKKLNTANNHVHIDTLSSL